jgi:SulP family sulfate permease
MSLKTIFPIFELFGSYTWKEFKSDIYAGLIVGVILIPQGMAYALLAGLPPVHGLYAVTIPLLMYAVLGTSRQLAVGPVAMDSILTASAIQAYAAFGTNAYIEASITLALIVGAIQFLMGIFRMGFLVNFIAQPVMSGFTSAAALVIMFSQLNHLTGIDFLQKDHIFSILLEWMHRMKETNWPTFILGMLSVLLIITFKELKLRIPGALILLVMGIIITKWGDLNAIGVNIVGEIPAGLPDLYLPKLSMPLCKELLPAGFAISLVGFLESFSIAKTMQKLHNNYKLRANQELIALGSVNIMAAIVRAFPISGGFSRTAVNHQSGATSGIASVVSAGFIMLTLLFFTPYFYYLPKAILAAIILFAVYTLIDLKEPKFLWKSNRQDFFMLLTTFLGTLLLGIQIGIGIGVLLSLSLMIFRATKPHVAILGRVPNSDVFRNIHRFPDVEVSPEVLIVRFDADIFFANISFFVDLLNDWIKAKGPRLRWLILNMESVNYIDSTGIQQLLALVNFHKKNNLCFCFTSVKGPVRDLLVRAGVVPDFGEQHFFLTVGDAQQFVMRNLSGSEFENPNTSLTLQSNNA